MNTEQLEPEADALLRAGKKVANDLSDIPALYSVAISLKRIADSLEKLSKPQLANKLSDEEYDKLIETHPRYIVNKP